MLVGRLLSAYLSSFISAVIMQWIDADNGILAFQPIGGNAIIKQIPECILLKNTCISYKAML